MFDHNHDLKSTFLSKNVYEIIVTLSSSKSCEYSQCITDELFLNWAEIDYALENISGYEMIVDHPHNWFFDKVKHIWSISNLVHNKFTISSSEKKMHLFTFTSWFINSHELEIFIKGYQSVSDNDVILYLLKLTSRLERNLGDIYSASGNSVPFLLKDLLASEYLEQKLGKIQVRFLQLIMGCVQGLNLRNIAWHGFFCPGELDKRIILLFLVAIATLGKQILKMDYPSRLLIKANYWDTHSELLHMFYDEFDVNSLMDGVRACNHISVNHQSSWEFALELYQKQRFGDSLVFVLPLLENMLRSVFCAANNCPERVLTAESSVYYITLDDILAQQISEVVENNIEKVINTKMFQMLLDLFVYQEGPRLRDKVSHCEIDINEIPQSIAAYTFGMMSSLIWMLSNVTVRGNSVLEILSAPEKYVPLYHPSSLLKRSMLSVCDRINKWTFLQTPSEFINIGDDYLMILETLRKNIKYDFTDINDLFTTISINVEATSLLTIFRPKAELELISCLRKIINNLKLIDVNIVTNSQTKHEQWLRREMKSRMRDNYSRMTSCLPVLQCGIAYLISLILVTLKSINEAESNEIKRILRSYKRCLKYAENVLSMSNITKNRWNEIKEATITIIYTMENT